MVQGILVITERNLAGESFDVFATQAASREEAATEPRLLGVSDPSKIVAYLPLDREQPGIAALAAILELEMEGEAGLAGFTIELLLTNLFMAGYCRGVAASDSRDQ